MGILHIGIAAATLVVGLTLRSKHTLGRLSPTLPGAKPLRCHVIRRCHQWLCTHTIRRGRGVHRFARPCDALVRTKLGEGSRRWSGCCAWISQMGVSFLFSGGRG